MTDDPGRQTCGPPLTELPSQLWRCFTVEKAPIEKFSLTLFGTA